MSDAHAMLAVAPSSTEEAALSPGVLLMRPRLSVLALLATSLLVGCGNGADATAPVAATPSTTAAVVGPSGLEVESEQAARAVLDARAEAERLAAEAAARAAAEAAAQQAAAEAAAAAERAAEEAAAAQRAAEAAAAQAVIDAEGGCPPGWSFDEIQGCFDPESSDAFVDEDDGYVTSELEIRCSDGTATVEECFGPGSDLNENGIADMNE